ncbi:hypothetical protein I6A84_26375 [Frankia sp. CNm7]|nr:hypothetical protein [Frankia nepalensis]
MRTIIDTAMIGPSRKILSVGSRKAAVKIPPMTTSTSATSSANNRGMSLL